ncbi:MAG: hypothetical protein L0241_27230 [Planctomycetia bacterium]|nr:hypothetical protein [Planctomycetia bacterium]
MKPLFAVALGVMIFAFSAPAKADDSAKLVGMWQVTKSTGETPVGSTVEFTKDGKLTAIAILGEKEVKLNGTYKVEKDKLMVNLTIGEMKVEEMFTIKKITADDLELEDKDKKVDTLKKKK